MPLKIIRQDITKIECDAIVNPSNKYLYPGGGADLSIHEAAGSELLKACEALGGCEVGKAKITPAFNLPCKYVIHTAGPNWYSLKNSKKVLVSCYEECLKLATEHNCESVAFPLIAAGSYGFPKEDVLKIATKVISDFLFDNEMLVYLVVYDKTAFRISEKIFCDVQSYIDDNYVAARAEKEIVKGRFDNRYSESLSEADFRGRREKAVAERRALAEEESTVFESVNATPMPCASMPAPSLDDMLRNMDKGFAETLFYYIDKKGITDVECYKKANIDRKLFSKIRSDKNYKPSKPTVIAFAISLELTLDETEDMLKKAGFALSHCNKFDVIIEYFISNEIYDIFKINETLFAFDQSLLGA